MSVRDVMIAAGSPGVNPGAKWISREVLTANNTSFAPDYVLGIMTGESNTKVVIFGYNVSGTNRVKIAYSTDITNWTLATVPSSALTVRNIAYGNGVYVAVGSSATSKGGIFTSTNAVTWVERSVPPSWDAIQPYHIVFTGSIFLITGNNQKCATSVDGINWAHQTNFDSVWDNGGIANVMWTGSNFLVVRDDNGRMAVSSNGVTWSVSNALTNYMTSVLGYTQFINSIRNDGNKIAGFCGGAFTFGSQNGGSSWERLVNLSGIAGGAFTNPLNLEPHNNSYVMVDQNNGYAYASYMWADPNTGYYIYIQGHTYTSLGTNFEAYPYVPSQRSLNGVRYLTGNYPGFYVYGPYGRLWRLASYSSPTDKTSTVTKQDLYYTRISDIYAVATNGTSVITVGKYGRIAKGLESDVASGTNFAIQSNTLNQTANWGSSSAINAAVWTFSKYIVAGESGKVATSSDGATWTYQTGLSSTAFGTANVNCIASNGTTCIVAGASGKVATTTDGVTWTNQTGLSSTSWSTSNVLGAVWNGSTFLVVGDSGKTATSTDGVTWVYSAGLSGTTWGTSACYAAAWSSTLSLFVVVGASGKIATSANGTSWTVRTSGTTATLRSITFANGKFIAVGSGPTVLYSEDGVNWSNKSGYITTPWGSASANCVAWLGNRFVIGGANGLLASSP